MQAWDHKVTLDEITLGALIGIALTLVCFGALLFDVTIGDLLKLRANSRARQKQKQEREKCEKDQSGLWLG